jgi:hypothetical protein
MEAKITIARDLELEPCPAIEPPRDDQFGQYSDRLRTVSSATV